MRATVMFGARDVRIETLPDAHIVEPTDAVVAVSRACICGSDLWPYRGLEHISETGRRMGHEAIGVVEAVGSDVRRIKRGDLVVMPFAYSDGTCAFCHEGLQTSCIHGGFFGIAGMDGAQAQALRVPFADGTLFVLPVGKDDALMPSLLTLSDVMGTGHHAAVAAKVGPGKKVAIVGDGAVGLCGVIAARRFGAEQIIILGRHGDRIALAREFGATDVVSERGDEAVGRTRAHRRRWRSRRARVRRSRRVDAQCNQHRASGWRSGPCRRSAERDDVGVAASVLQQRHGERRTRAGPRIHRRASARHCRGQDRAWPGLRPKGVP